MIPSVPKHFILRGLGKSMPLDDQYYLNTFYISPDDTKLSFFGLTKSVLHYFPEQELLQWKNGFDVIMEANASRPIGLIRNATYKTDGSKLTLKLTSVSKHMMLLLVKTPQSKWFVPV